MPPTITESRFHDLKAKLRELFELDKSDLDFGIYRIIAAKNAEVTEFLDRQLKDVVRQTLTDHGAGATDRAQAKLDKTIADLTALSAPVDTNPSVISLRAEIAAAGGGTIAELEADIYNHLLAFFGRYYDEGDFISQRRYKGDTYAIPYSGEEVTLHWANKDQYYIKSGEWHKDYRFKAGAGGSKSIRFRLVEATQETGNNKEADDAKRRYILASENPIEATENELTLRFEFRAPTAKERERAESGSPPPVAIFGGDYAKDKNPKKGDEREQFCADAEKRALKAVPDAWKPIVGSLAATESKPFRTILGKHLDHFTARNTFDYFIHKDLGGFLRRELDFYIKNEVVRLDDLEKLPPDQLQRVQGKVRAIRAVAGRLIGFLASLEDFQKRMWLKKKFVLNTNWLVTVDRIPAKLRDIVAANKSQWEEWEQLGFKPTKEHEGDGLFKQAKWGTRAYLDVCDKLVVDTAMFERAFSENLIVAISTMDNDQARSIDDDTCGLLIHSENSHALRFLDAAYRHRTDSVYIDPPYNTGTGDFLYKDSYLHSSWMAMTEDRLRICIPLLTQNGVLFSSIDDGEQASLRGVLDRAFGPENFVANVIWQKKYAPQNDATWMSDDHDFVLVYAKSRATWRPRKLARSDKQNASYRNPDNDARGPWKADNYKTNKTADQRPNLYYPIVHPMTGEKIWPSKSAVWRYTRETHDSNVREGRVWWGRDGSAQVPAYKRFLSDVEGVVPRTIWMHEEVGHNQDGVRELQDLFAESPFPSPKPVGLIDRALAISPSNLVMDFFAGSGTTAHAAISRVREGEHALRFLLIDMGLHFTSVIRPRVSKVLYSPDWKNGRAQSHDKGLSALVKYFALESYEDALNNLPAPQGTLMAGADAATKDALITYALDLEMGPHLLNLDAFRDPWGYTINAQLAGDAEIKKHRADLVETFNYLIGLKVHAYGPIERFDPEFIKAKHEDGLGRLKVKPHPGAVGSLKRDPNGPYAFQRVEGEINPALTGGAVVRVLIVWRKLTGDAERDAAVLEAWMARHRESTKERTEHRDYHTIYINGPVTLAQPTAEIRTVYPIEETFKAKMFEDTEGGT